MKIKYKEDLIQELKNHTTGIDLGNLESMYCEAANDIDSKLYVEHAESGKWVITGYFSMFIFGYLYCLSNFTNDKFKELLMEL